jgi:hypothetical protein
MHEVLTIALFLTLLVAISLPPAYAGDELEITL